ncbi:hypothetical protein L5515_015066 [Caenorhabditis briggsae]|uniref:F-box domain-containing protein n=1 Tax=Caenorhabditis briggsae TaxID=6238 RepID=A0AAE9EDY9_CAEBR|nr:hypothetical protein L5515_015066 [Caenorhabditis briggsae]
MTPWSILPIEVKSEVLKFTDFYSSNNVRLCSKSDQEAVETLKTNIPFLKINISSDHVTLIIIENTSEILRIDIIKEEDVEIYRSQNLECGLKTKILKSANFLEEIRNFFNGIFARKLEIESCSIENDELKSGDEILKIVGEKLSKAVPKKVILSGKSFQATKNALKTKNISSEILIRTWKKDISKNWTGYDWFKGFNVSGWNSKQGAQEHIIATTHIELYPYIALLQSWPNEKFHWFPGLHVADPQKKFSDPGSGMRNSTFIEFSTHQFIKIPIDSKKTMFVKFSKCGVSIRMTNEEDIDVEDTECGLEWMCLKCEPKTMEDWYFRETIGNLH